jgi:hypothetical protein
MRDDQIEDILFEGLSSEEEDSSLEWSYDESGESEDSCDEDPGSGTREDIPTPLSHQIPLLLPPTIKDPVTKVTEQPAKSPIVFSGVPGLKVPQGGRSPRGYFDLLANQRFYDLIVVESNSQAEHIFLNNPSPRARITQWKELTRAEMEVFLGLLFHMGTVKLNHMNDYWRKDNLIDLKCISAYMSRDRFQGILQALHFAKIVRVDEPVPEDRLHKIRPQITLFINSMSEIYSPNKELSLDESMVLWRGRLQFRQYMPGKRHKYGI